MELKQFDFNHFAHHRIVLIVPYGIKLQKALDDIERNQF